MTIGGSVVGLHLKELLLLLALRGLAQRPCELACVNGAEIGFSFLNITKRSTNSSGLLAGEQGGLMRQGSSCLCQKCRTTASGHSRRFDRPPLTSGLARSSDILRVIRHVAKVPIGE
jgi:hypothetical protein